MVEVSRLLFLLWQLWPQYYVRGKQLKEYIHKQIYMLSPQTFRKRPAILLYYNFKERFEVTNE